MMSAKLRVDAARATVVALAGILAFALVALASLGGAEAARQQQVNCGDTITADTTLDSDLLDCPNNGIVIGADDITLDLNGHTIDGDGEEFEQCGARAFCDAGVLNDGHNGVTVRDGSVREFAGGVFLFSARHNRVLDISSKRNTFFGFVANESAQSVIRDSSGNHNIPPEGDGLGLFGSHDFRIVDNTFRNNPGPGLHVDDSPHSLIEENLFSQNRPAILLEADRNRVRRNRFDRNGAGVLVSGRRNIVERNRLNRDGAGIAIEKGRRNLVARNVVIEPRARGISLGLDFADGTSIGGVDNIVRRNEVRGSGGDGFLVNAGGNNLLKRNVAKGAKEDGFDVESRSTKLTKNRARRNADLGIDAVRGVIDGGGNRARGNGDRRQCVNVKCHELVFPTLTPLEGARLYAEVKREVHKENGFVCRADRSGTETIPPLRLLKP
jgi:large repetitive protein